MKKTLLTLVLSAGLLLGLCATAHAADPTRTGTATVAAWHATENRTSMMAPCLVSAATIDETDGVVYATITFQNVSLLGVAVTASSIKDIKTISGSDSFPAQEISKTTTTYTVRVRVPDVAKDTVMKLTPPVMEVEQTLRLRLSAVSWGGGAPDSPATTTSSSSIWDFILRYILFGWLWMK